MENVKIYLSGGMTGLTEREQMNWRIEVMREISGNQFDISKKPVFFNPTQYYSPLTNEHKSEREAMEFELSALRKSDVVIVNFNAPNSIGTAMELMLAKEYHIPIIGVNPKGYKLHSWLLECCTRLCDSMDELVKHIVDFYLS